MNQSFDDLLAEANKLFAALEEHDPRPWSTSAKALDLSAHVGALSQAALEHEGFKPSRLNPEQNGKELATILFIVLDLARDLGVDFKTAFANFLIETKREANL